MVVRSDFTARLWSAELISESANLNAPRELLALNQTADAQYWLNYFRDEINKLRSEGVKPVGVDLASSEVNELVQANVGVSALRSGAVEKAQLQAGTDGKVTPLLEEAPPQSEKSPEATPVPPASPGDYKECPQCAEMVRARAKICRFCGYEFETAA